MGLFSFNKEEDPWKGIDEVTFTPDILQINIDTRDFKMVQIFKEKKVINRKFDKDMARKYPSRFIYTIEEVEAIINKIYEQSGGKAGWRCFGYSDNLYPEADNWNLKYILVTRIGDNEYVMLNKNHRVPDKDRDLWFGKLLKKKMWESGKMYSKQILAAH